MIPNLVLSAQAPDPNPVPNSIPNQDPKNSFMGFGKRLINSANLTKGQSFYLISTVIYLSFILLAFASSTIIGTVVAIRGDSLEDVKSLVPLDSLLSGLTIWLMIGAIYFIAYAVPEVRDRWLIKKNKKDV